METWSEKVKVRWVQNRDDRYSCLPYCTAPDAIVRMEVGHLLTPPKFPPPSTRSTYCCLQYARPSYDIANQCLQHVQIAAPIRRSSHQTANTIFNCASRLFGLSSNKIASHVRQFPLINGSVDDGKKERMWLIRPVLDARARNPSRHFGGALILLGGKHPCLLTLLVWSKLPSQGPFFGPRIVLRTKYVLP